MRVLLDIDEFGRLTCGLSDGAADAVVTASNMPEAAEDLAAAVAAAIENASGECFWEEACGEYRWVFRRQQDRVRVAVMWSTGTVTGWEHVFWAECPLEAFRGAFTTALAKIQSARSPR